MADIALIERQLQASDEATADLVEALADGARALRLPVDDRRSDTHRFTEGADSVDAATWLQCGGLVYALSHGEVADERAFAARVARRIFDLTPSHY